MNKFKFLIINIFIVLSILLIGCNKEKELVNITFIDFYGNVVEIKTVDKGSDASGPTLNNVPYHNFYKWDQDLKDVQSDITTKALYNITNEEYEMTDYNYWLKNLSKTEEINKILLTKEEIKEYNKKITSQYNSTKVVDLLKLDTNVSNTYILNLINSYTNINKYNVYHYETKEELSTTEIDEILANRNLDNIPSSFECMFGIVTDFTWMRSYPTLHYSKTYERDYFQETSLNVCEPVIIYHTSKDGNWFFVQASNYNGWVQTKDIAVCTYGEYSEFIEDENVLVVISDYVKIQDKHVRMGQAFPLISKGSEYKIQFPTRSDQGKLVIEEVVLPICDDYHVGYLPYTYENVFKQAFKLLGIDYSWGDKEQLGRDCSSTQNAIYHSFGFKMPRNTSNQNNIPTYGTSLVNLKEETLKTSYKVGTLIFSSGHVMMYIGCDNEGNCYIFHNTSAGDEKCIIQKLTDYGLYKIKGALRLQ